MDGLAKQNGTIPKCLGSVSAHFHLCISQLQETVHPIEQQLEQHRTPGLAAPESYRTLRDGSFEDAFPGTSCQATIGVSLRDGLADL
jgi:hypothetical protein